MHGIHSMLVTPFLPDGSLDLASLRTLVKFSAQAGVHGITVLGVLGEVQKLDDAERKKIVEVAAEAAAAAHVTLTVGISHGAARIAAQFACQAEESGAIAVMLAPPPLLAAGPALLAFLQQVAGAVQIPVILQDYPPTTGTTLPLPFLLEVAKHVPNISAIKCEDIPTTVKISALKRALGDRFELLGGLGGLYFLEELLCGASGTLTGFAYPEILRSIYDNYKKGDRDSAVNIFASALPLIRLEAQANSGLGIRKTILQQRGAIAHATMRVPYTAPDPATLAELELWSNYLQKQGTLTTNYHQKSM